MRVVLHGVRGSTPAPGAAFVRIGGHTSCVSITPDGCDAPTLLLDAGTGLADVTTALAGEPFRGDILLTHLHWDHVQGLPFFRAGDHDDAQVRLMLPAQGAATVDDAGSAATLLARSMSPPHFPIGPEGLRGDWHFSAIDAGTLSAGGCTVTAVEVPHKGGRTYGFRVEADGASMAYLPDHHPGTDRAAGLLLADGVDVLCHGAMFSESERAVADMYGHCTLGDALDVARAADVGRLVLVHHAPARTDTEVEQLARQLAAGQPLPVVAGRAGTVVLGNG
ncbi:MAG TPA: MBL fold metallo-hydrolase [Nocardioidaceae bacterium]|jgi:phosphoribosyl 1,2-cyclic phosphodiesterase|nr:MBL fold metallo-hydrolase [Nocardioidaceae bacterium]